MVKLEYCEGKAGTTSSLFRAVVFKKCQQAESESGWRDARFTCFHPVCSDKTGTEAGSS